jgi:hypothetical protein
MQAAPGTRFLIMRFLRVNFRLTFPSKFVAAENDG